MRYERVVIEAIGYELAPVVVSTEELEERLSAVFQRLRIPKGQLATLTGIHERRWWQRGTRVSEGAVAAAVKALELSSLGAEDLGALIYAGVCRDHHEPATACVVAGELAALGHEVPLHAAVFDLSNACLGVLNGMLDVANRIELGQIEAGMVVASESARDIVEATIAALHEDSSLRRFSSSVATMTGGSGAVAMILRRGGEDEPRRLLGGVLETAPEHHRLCRWGTEVVGESAGGSRTLREFMVTDAVSVLEHGVALGRRTWQRFLTELRWQADRVDRTICHQVGLRHRQEILRALEVPPERDFAIYSHLGNTGTVALPLALAVAEERGFVASGHRVGLLGIGSGLNCLMLGVDW
ncbi:MAG: 3-oxoacyl-ACP synthase III [Acidobacteria bacterium]|nr:MAG: 3-oxoacyl-ACP synthase III [Acidobacteriota bacterium]REK00146.1 MAG: 3-oxoacyl-ACP synthase III [Acidobacteriota bacterium]